jgi:1-acyl-sn-glycerol-3-phosphate acyltransferase
MLDSKLDTGSDLGLSVKEPYANPAPVQHGEYSQASRALALGSYFLSGVMAVNVSQFLGAPLYLINKDWYNAWTAFTKQSFGLLTTTLTQFWAPTVMRISGDKSMRGQLLKTTDGDLLCNFPERLVLIANHQIYTDWLYLWWIAYTNGMHGRLYIVLKESLRRIPVIGWGMQFYQFIFMKRNWELDKPNMAKHLQKLNKSSSPMWLLLFPEGTNLAPCTRNKSKKWAAKNGIPDMQHQLLPRSTGLRFCLQELRGTVEYLYDCTIGYEGVPRGQYAQDIFTLKASYLEGRPPKSVSMYWRRFKISCIPIDNPEAFDIWLRAHWTAKDKLLEGFVRTGRFPAETGSGFIETEVKAVRWYEFMQIFAPVGLVGLVLYAFYGSLPKRFVKSLNKKNMRKKVETVQKAVTAPGKLLPVVPALIGSKKLPIGPVIKMLTEKQLPIVQAVSALADKNLLIGQFPVGLLLKAAAENHLPVATIQSLLKTLSGKGLLKGAVPKVPLERRLLKGSDAGVSKPGHAAVAQKPINKSPLAPTQLNDVSSTQKATVKQLATPTQVKAEKGTGIAQSTTTKIQASGIKPAVIQNPSARQAPGVSSKSQASTESTLPKSLGAQPKPPPVQGASGNQKPVTAQKSAPLQNVATLSKTPVTTTRTPAVAQKPITAQKPVAAQKVTPKQTPSVATKNVSKKAPIQKSTLNESTSPNPKAPKTKSPPKQAPANQPKKLQPTPSPAAKQPASNQSSGSLPKKLEASQGGRPRPPKLGPSKLAAKPTPAISQTKSPARQSTSQPLKKPNTS